MFTTKKKRIRKYLEQKTDDNKLAFDFFLSDYLHGVLKNDLKSIGIKRIDIHIDWLDDVKCIGIQGQYSEYYMDLQIYPTEFSISFDFDEADEDIIHPLESKEQLYTVLTDIINTL